MQLKWSYVLLLTIKDDNRNNPTQFKYSSVIRCIQSQTTQRKAVKSPEKSLKSIKSFPSSCHTVLTGYKYVCVQAEGDRLPPGHTVSQLETCKIRSIHARTLEHLMEMLLTAFGDNDLTYTSIFLSTHRKKVSGQEVKVFPDLLDYDFGVT